MPQSRRTFLTQMAALGLGTAVTRGAPKEDSSPRTGAPATATRPIVAENQKPGTRDWLLTKVDTVLEPKNPLGENQPHYVRSQKIEGFASDTSFQAGDQATFFISAAPAVEVTIDILIAWATTRATVDGSSHRSGRSA